MFMFTTNLLKLIKCNDIHDTMNSEPQSFNVGSEYQNIMVSRSLNTLYCSTVWIIYFQCRHALITHSTYSFILCDSSEPGDQDFCSKETFATYVLLKSNRVLSLFETLIVVFITNIPIRILSEEPEAARAHHSVSLWYLCWACAAVVSHFWGAAC